MQTTKSCHVQYLAPAFSVYHDFPAHRAPKYWTPFFGAGGGGNPNQKKSDENKDPLISNAKLSKLAKQHRRQINHYICLLAFCQKVRRSNKLLNQTVPTLEKNASNLAFFSRNFTVVSILLKWFVLRMWSRRSVTIQVSVWRNFCVSHRSFSRVRHEGDADALLREGKVFVLMCGVCLKML